MRRLISLLLTAIILFSSFSIGVTAYAAPVQSTSYVQEETHPPIFDFKVFFRQFLNKIFALIGLESKIQVTGIDISEDNVEFMQRTRITLNAKVYPENAANQKIIWKSDNTAVSVAEDGTLYGYYPCTTTITATTEDGEFVDSCKVTVTPYVAPCTDFRIYSFDENDINKFSNIIGKTYLYRVDPTPLPTTDEMSCTSSNPEIIKATTEEDASFSYVCLNYLSTGTTTITVTYGNVTKNYTFEIS
jgi:hypothetical protein